MGFNNFTKMGRKLWTGMYSPISDTYKTSRHVVSTIHGGAEFVDRLLDKSTQYGVPHSLVDIVRDNPVYSSVYGSIQLTDDLVNKDIPMIANAIEKFIEHSAHQKHAPGSGSGMKIPEMPGDRFRTFRAATGFTPNNQPSSRHFIGAGASMA